MSREAMKQALEALDNLLYWDNGKPEYDEARVAITALRQALEQPADEPVAWMKNSTVILASNWSALDTTGWTPLYTRPQPADEITKLLGEIGVLVGLLKWASQVIETVEGEDVAECEALMELQNKITYAIQGAST